MNDVYLPLYFSWVEITAGLTDEDFGRLIRCAVHFCQTGEEIQTNLSPSGNVARYFIIDTLKRSFEKSKIGKENAIARWNAEKKPREETKEEPEDPAIKPPKAPTKLPTPRYDELFKQFWEQYPRKTDKRKAEAAFIRLKPSDELVAQMIAALERQKQSDQWTRDGGRFIPHPTTWLNGRRWEDEIEAPRPPQNPTQGARKSEPEEKPRFGNFDVKDAFKKAMERTYGGNIDVDKELERMKEK